MTLTTCEDGHVAVCFEWSASCPVCALNGELEQLRKDVEDAEYERDRLTDENTRLKDEIEELRNDSRAYPPTIR